MKKITEIRTCEVCGITSEHKHITFNKESNMCLCDKHLAQFRKFKEFKDSNQRSVFDPNEIRIYENYGEIDTYDEYGNVVETYIVDLDQIDFLRQHKWRTVYKLDKPYLFTGNQQKKKIYFHRYVLNATDLQVDHIDGNTKNNLKSNLRQVTLQQNMLNLKKKNNNNTGIRGVSFDKRKNGYKVDFTYKKTRYYFKCYPKLEQSVYIRYLCEITFLNEFRNESNDFLYLKHISKLSENEKIELNSYFKERINTLKKGVESI